MEQRDNLRQAPPGHSDGTATGAARDCRRAHRPGAHFAAPDRMQRPPAIRRAAALQKRMQHLQGVVELDAAHGIPRAPDAGTQAPARAERRRRRLEGAIRRVRQRETGRRAQLRRAMTCRSTGCARACARRFEQVNTLMARQGQLIETVAINELKARGERLEALPDAGSLCGRRQLRPRDEIAGDGGGGGR